MFVHAGHLLQHAIGITCLIVMTVVPCFGQQVFQLGDGQVTIDEATLSVVVMTGQGDTFKISSPSLDCHSFELVRDTATDRSWILKDLGLVVTASVDGSRLIMHFVSDHPGRITWPIIPPEHTLRAYILPMFEGIYAPADDPDWMAHLVSRSPMDTTADLSMPFIGLDLGNKTVTYLFDTVFDDQIVFEQDVDGTSVSVTHTFQDNWDTWEYKVIVELSDPSPIAPAKAYRDYLAEHGRLVTMRQKIVDTPKAERLPGAIHAYLWDAGLFSHMDATDWKGLCARLIEAERSDQDMPGKRLWGYFNDEARDAVRQITQERWPSKYLKSLVAEQISAYLVDRIKQEDDANPNARRAVLGDFCRAFAGQVRPYQDWGDGISIGLLDELYQAGIDWAVLCLGNLRGADYKPQVAEHADALGFLFGPYDSYHSIHPPDAHPDQTWETAQFGWELFRSGAIVNRDGSKSAGFKQRGYHLSPLAARPYVEQRVNEYMARVPFNAVFVDCDAYGQFFDDYHPEHTATKQDDMLARLDRLRWLNRAHGLVVGSEGGSAYAVPVIHFAHGMLTPVIGWGDPDLKDRSSPYYKGAYYPPDAPATFVKQVPLKPSYQKFFYDPRYRLPLYQAVFHDAVVTTHHWGNASLKFKDQVATVALLEQLYNVPPLYHLNHAEWKKHRTHILSHYAFFSPLHRELATQAMTDFHWLTDDRLVQQTTFADGTRIIANFREEPVVVSGIELPARSVVAIRPDNTMSVYTP